MSGVPRNRTALAVIVSFVVAGCQDPGDGAFMVQVRNDGEASLLVDACYRDPGDGTCPDTRYSDDRQVPPGEVHSVVARGNSAPWEGDAIPGEIVLRDAESNRKLGCIPYRIAKKHEDYSVRFDASQADPDACGSDDYVDPADDGTVASGY